MDHAEDHPGRLVISRPLKCPKRSTDKTIRGYLIPICVHGPSGTPNRTKKIYRIRSARQLNFRIPNSSAARGPRLAPINLSLFMEYRSPNSLFVQNCSLLFPC
jgi:hypothetical protein